MTLPSIHGPKPDANCKFCHGSGFVCENHGLKAWGGMCCDERDLANFPIDRNAKFFMDNDVQIVSGERLPLTLKRPENLVPKNSFVCTHGACHCGAGTPCPSCDPERSPFQLVKVVDKLELKDMTVLGEVSGTIKESHYEAGHRYTADRATGLYGYEKHDSTSHVPGDNR